MTIQTERYVKLPVWLVSALIPTIVTLGIYYTVNKVSTASIKKQVEVNTLILREDIPNALDKKVDRTEFKIIIDQLNRMERKMDSHIAE
jgi:hypothetical protein